MYYDYGLMLIFGSGHDMYIAAFSSVKCDDLPPLDDYSRSSVSYYSAYYSVQLRLSHRCTYMYVYTVVNVIDSGYPHVNMQSKAA